MASEITTRRTKATTTSCLPARHCLYVILRLSISVNTEHHWMCCISERAKSGYFTISGVFAAPAPPHFFI